MAKKAIIYCRMATEESLNNISAKHQFDICSKYAQRRNYEVVEKVKEFGSGLRINDNLANCIKKIVGGEVDVLIVSEPTRIARDYWLFLKIRKLLGSKLELLSSSDCKYDFERDFREQIFMSIAGYYGHSCAQRQKQSKARQKTIQP